jgi:hypothetical protein
MLLPETKEKGINYKLLGSKDDFDHVYAKIKALEGSSR